MTIVQMQDKKENKNCKKSRNGPFLKKVSKKKQIYPTNCKRKI